MPIYYTLKTERGKQDSRNPITSTTNSLVGETKKRNKLSTFKSMHFVFMLFCMLIGLGNAKAELSMLPSYIASTNHDSPSGLNETLLFLTDGTTAKNDIHQASPNQEISGNLLTNDTDEQGDFLAIQSVTYLDATGTSQVLVSGTGTNIYDESGVLAGSIVVIYGLGIYGFESAPNYTGKVSVSYVIVDDSVDADTDSAILSIEVVPYPTTDNSNNDVVAQDDTNTAEQGETVTSYVLENDSDPDGDVISITQATALNSTGQPITLTLAAQDIYDENSQLAGNASIGSSGDIVFEAALAYTGKVAISYTAADGNGSTDDAILLIGVDPLNTGDNDSYANDDANTGLIRKVLSGNILANDYDPEGDTQTVTTAENWEGIQIMIGSGTATTLEFVGSIVIDTDGSYTFTPEPDFVGTERIIYTVCDNASPQACEMASLYLTVLPTNYAAAENDINQTSINLSVSGRVLTNDRDKEGDVLSVQSASYLDATGTEQALTLGVGTVIYNQAGASAGNMTLLTDGTYDFVPTIGFTGKVRMSYVMTDDNPNPATDNAILNIKVFENPYTDGANNEVTAHEDTNTMESGTTVRINVLANDVELDGDVLAVPVVKGKNSTGGTALLSSGDPKQVYDEDGVLAGIAIFQSGNTLVYKALSDYVGEVIFTYAVQEPGGLFDVADMVVTVEPASPDFDTYGNDDADMALQDETMIGNVQDNDYDPDGVDQDVVLLDLDGDGIPETLPEALVVMSVTKDGILIGTVTMDAKVGEYFWDPQPDFVGTAQIAYTITDGDAYDISTLYLSNLPLNTTNAVNDFNNTLFETPVVGNVSTNDFDIEGHNQGFALVGSNGGMNVAEGTVSLDSNGSYVYTPAIGFSGETTFLYNACDDNNPMMCDMATVYIEVLPAIDAEGQPIIANPDVNSIPTGQTANGNVLSNDLDPEGRELVVTTILSSVTVSGTDSRGTAVADAGTLTLNADGTYAFTPTGAFIGTIVQNYTACTVQTPVECDNTILIISVTPNNGNSTIANDDAVISDAGIPVTGNLLQNDYDAEGDDQKVTAFYYDSNGDGISDASATMGTSVTISGYDELGGFIADFGTLNVSTEGAFTFVSSVGFPGNAVIPYTACDDNATVACDNATLVITVLNVFRDFTDGPAVYGAAWHRAITDKNNDNKLDGATDVWLGGSTNFETLSLASVDASRDDFDDALVFGGGDGEFPEVMLPSADYDIDITLNSVDADFVYYGLWIDWDEDGVYEDFYSGSASTNGATIVGTTVTAPTLVGSMVNVRLRADDDELFVDDFSGGRTNGEVEDYQNAIALPVDLLYFEGSERDCTNELQWATASEKNNSFFMVEYSTDGENFEELQRIEGNGNSSEEIEYSYVHEDISNVYNYYRLMQVDFDGTFVYSETVFVKSDCPGLAAEGINIYPNPSTGLVKAEIMSTGLDKEIEIMVTDVVGRVLVQKKTMIQAGINRENIDLMAYPSGMYMISIIANGEKINTFPISLVAN